MFCRYGFFPGFSDLLFATLFADHRCQGDTSDIWLLSVFVKLASFGISDPNVVKRIADMLDKNIERYVYNALYKTSLLVGAINYEVPIHRDLILKRMKSINFEVYN